MLRPSLSVLLPSSILAEEPDLRQKTLKVGLVGRTLAIFRVEGVCIYNDDDPRVGNQAVEAELISTLLRYMETPQYLRKLLFPRMKELRFAGSLPPLRTPHHPLANERNSPGDFREAVSVKTEGGRSLLELGLKERGLLEGRLEAGERLTVKLGERMGRDLVAVKRAMKAETGEYWGYEVFRAKSIAEGLKVLRADYRLGTSRYGTDPNGAVRKMQRLAPKRVAVAFGGPYAGLFEICGRQHVDAKELFDAVVNTVPDQGVATVRTEEALLVTLGLFNALIEG